MITTVNKIKEGMYVLNESVVIHNFDFEEDQISYSIDYDENTMSEQEAFKLCDEFIGSALSSYIEELK